MCFVFQTADSKYNIALLLIWNEDILYIYMKFPQNKQRILLKKNENEDHK